jgi:elongation factor G
VLPLALEKRAELISCLADVDEDMEMLFLEEQEPSIDQLYAAIEKGVKNLSFSPVMMGSAYKNKGVQQALDAICRFLPNPQESENKAYRLNKETGLEEQFKLELDSKKPFVGLTFKLDEGQFGQLTYIRAY